MKNIQQACSAVNVAVINMQHNLTLVICLSTIAALFIVRKILALIFPLLVLV